MDRANLGKAVEIFDNGKTWGMSGAQFLKACTDLGVRVEVYGPLLAVIEEDKYSFPQFDKVTDYGV